MKIKKQIGYSKEDWATSYAKFFTEGIAPIPESVLGALSTSPYSSEALLPVAQASYLLQPGYAAVETGYCLLPDGSARVAILTQMPEVIPVMWDWWFGWHGCQDNRYKLWHPLAHRSAKWKDGRSDLAYIGRTSMIEEYIGKNMEKASIRFVDPSELGFKSTQILDKSKVVVICARVGYTHYPLDFGWLAHQIRATESGSEMRSRFWMGGEHIQIRAKGILPRLLSKVLQKIRPISNQQAGEILQHCSEEMNHLAAFLPQLYAEMANPETK